MLPKDITKIAEYKRKLSEQKLGNRNPAKRPEVKLKISISQKGVKKPQRTTLHKTNLSISLKNTAKERKFGFLLLKPEMVKKRTLSIKSNWQNNKKEMIDKIFTPETRQKMRISHIRALKDGKYANKKDTKLELTIENFLNSMNLVLNKDYFKQVAIPHEKPKYLVDFYLPEYNLIIEGFGCWYHKCPQCGYIERREDVRKREFLVSLGFNIWIIWDHQVNNAKLLHGEKKIDLLTFRHIFDECYISNW